MKANWVIRYEGFDETTHPLQEALCTLENGYFTIRAVPEISQLPHDIDDKKEFKL